MQGHETPYTSRGPAWRFLQVDPVGGTALELWKSH